MKIQWLHKHDCDRLLVFCNGWGMDGAPFVPLQALDLDVLMCYDYSDLSLDENLFSLMDGYRAISLLSWSMGVWVGQYLFSSMADRFEKTIAMNGTLCPVHDRYGIPPEIISATLAGFDEAARLKFYRRMCRENDTLKRFLANRPKRKIAGQIRELKNLLHTTDCCTAEASLYTDIVIADKDLVVLTDNQRRFWQQKKIHPVDGYHFLFYQWKTWDALLQDPGKCAISQCLPEGDWRTHGK